MHKKLSSVAFIMTIAIAVPLLAEKVDMKPKQLRDAATHVVTGKVAAIYERTKEKGDWKYTRYIAEIRVTDCEKGTGIEKGDLVYARYWRRAWIGERQMPPTTTGHRGLPKEGDSIRVYLARNAYDGFGNDNHDGGFNVIGANGFETLEKDARKT